jgi:hypothetical protein
MRVQVIAAAAILLSGCSGELVQRPPASDPTSVAAAEAPLSPTPSYQPDPLLNPIPPRSPEAPPTGTEQLHSPTSTPPGNPPMREEPGARAVYTCPMHPEVRSPAPGRCPKCGMTLIPKAGGQ